MTISVTLRNTKGSRLTYSEVDANFENLADGFNEQEDWITPTLLNSWVNTASQDPTQFMKDNMGFVWIKGCVTSGSDNLIFTLPEGYRPAGSQRFVVDANGAFGRVIIADTGSVLKTIGSSTDVALNTIRFRAEQ